MLVVPVACSSTPSVFPVQLGVSQCLEMLEMNEVSHREDEMRVGGKRKEL